ncbi:flagellar biosynthesis protein [Falsirhodobacter xinxiangensis]|uniref:flagellar biosynthesis protein n=1 Tax=Falsirhodobacter xinxiangensis TaxID=2530049 RepID=UPI0010AB15E4|nr:flagellar biosynthesis protein [Rhodobacter xinxiangensis]
MIALRLEVFETEDDTVVTDRAAMEEARRAAFAEGLAAGRAEAAAEAETARHGHEAAAMRNLADLAFTFHEARAHVLSALHPLFEQIATALLPNLARQALAPVLAEALMPMAEGLAETPIRVAHHPDAADAVARVLAECPFPLEAVLDPALPTGAVQLRLGQTETRVDLTRATEAITAALRGFFAPNEQERMYG